MKNTMKKVLLVAAIVMGTIFASNAQELGVRFGDVSGGNVAIDGIFSTGQFSRIHGDVSFGNGFGVDLLWDFLYRPLGGEAFNWYLGVGPYLGVFDNGKDDDTNFNLGAAFEIGLEYRFNSIPIALGLDYRPLLEIVDNTDFHSGGFGLNIRYVFGS
jgi:hypothetical protein